MPREGDRARDRRGHARGSPRRHRHRFCIGTAATTRALIGETFFSRPIDKLTQRRYPIARAGRARRRRDDRTVAGACRSSALALAASRAHADELRAERDRMRVAYRELQIQVELLRRRISSRRPSASTPRSSSSSSSRRRRSSTRSRATSSATRRYAAAADARRPRHRSERLRPKPKASQSRLHSNDGRATRDPRPRSRRQGRAHRLRRELPSRLPKGRARSRSSSPTPSTVSSRRRVSRR